jgi:hypothetical protein
MRWLVGSADLVTFYFQAYSLPFSIWPAVLTSAPMPPVVRGDLRCSANSWSTCLADLHGTHSAGSVMATVRTPEASAPRPVLSKTSVSGHF